MTSRERILATLRGKSRDHVPMWMRDEFNLSPRFDSYLPTNQYRTIGSGLEYDEFTDGWITRDANRDAILERYRQLNGDVIRECKIPGNATNRFLVVPPESIKQTSVSFEEDYRLENYVIPTPKGDLDFAVKFQKDVSTQWITEEPVKCTEDLHKVMSVPWSLPELDFTTFFEEDRALGENGVSMIQVDTPLVTVSGLMKFEDYLMLTITDRGLLRELCDMAYERISAILEVCLEAGVGPIYRLNGSEQSTPPMNFPDVYEQFVHRYEKRLMQQVHDHGCYGAVHCHGHIRSVLPLMKNAGVDLLDPIEAPPSGDVQFAEAWEIAGDDMTLAGNVQLRDLQELPAKQITEQVKSLLEVSKGRRFILDTSASPLTHVDDRSRDNYLAMLDTWAEYR